MGVDLSEQDCLLLSLLQDRFPLTPLPFTDLAERLGWRESVLLARIGQLKEGGPLRQIGAIFDTRRLGYASTLVALAVQPERLDDVARGVSRHRGVSHNYAREHAFNLWFTLAVPPEADLQREVGALAAQTGVLQTLTLPVVRTFKVDARFDLESAVSGLRERIEPIGPAETRGAVLATDDIPFVRALQDDLPLTQRPFYMLAQREALGEEALIEAARRFLATGIMRRYGATLRHRQAGYTANAMVCWELPAGCIEAAGQAAARCAAVSHCYERQPRPPAWPYQLFTMVHGRSEAELTRAIDELAALIRPRQVAVLRTVREYKKARLRYFEEGW